MPNSAGFPLDNPFLLPENDADSSDTSMTRGRTTLGLHSNDCRLLYLLYLLFLLALVIAVHAQTNDPITATGNRFEKNVESYEAMDLTNPPPKNAILLVGDSQFYRWKTLAEDLPDYTIVNRGIDSFQTSDLVYFADRLVLPYHPRMIVLHVGGNDVHTGKSPEQILADFKTFVAK